MTLKATEMVVDPAEISPNPWNPNVESPFIYERVKRSIRTYGMVTPPVVRRDPTNPKKLQIVNGEHRWRAWSEERPGEAIRITLIENEDGSIPRDDVAQRLTLLLNAQGQNDDLRLAELLADLAQVPDIDLTGELPFTEAELEHLSSLTGFDFSGEIERGPGKEKGEDDERPWATLSYDLPADAADVVRKAIKKALENDREADWMGLERIAADFLAGVGA